MKSVPARPSLNFVLLWGVLFSILTVILSLPLYRQGLSAVNVDQSFALIDSQKFETGEWAAFYFRHGYGGTALGYVKALWCLIWDRVVPSAASESWSGQLFFVYCVCAAMMTFASVAVASRYCSRLGTWVVGLLATVGFCFWDQNYGNEFYFTSFFLCCALLIWASKYSEPFLETSPRTLFGMGALSGFALYSYRLSIVYIFCVFFPFKEVGVLIKKSFAPRTGVDRFLFIAGAFFLGLYLYISFFDGDFGTFDGIRKLKLDANPNLPWIFLFWGGLYIKLNYRDLDRLTASLWVKRGAILAAGTLMGMFPEIVAKKIHSNPVVMDTGFRFNGLTELLSNLIHSPMNFRDVVAGVPTIGQHFSVVLFIWALWFFSKTSRKDSVAWRLVAAAPFNLFLFCAFSTYATGISRYLFPLFPVLLIACGKLVDSMPSRTRTAQALFVLLLLGHIGYQWHGQLAIARNFERSGEKERRQEIVAAWRAEGVEFVFCNKYDECNQYAFVGGNRPVFAPPLHWLIPEKTLEQARQVTHAGFQLDQCPASLDENARFEWAERKWKLRFLKKVQGKCLLIGDAS